jgi:hypothetical protein
MHSANGKTYPLENLLPLDILHPLIQVANPLHNIVNLALIRALNLARLPNRHIQRKLHSPVYTTSTQPAATAAALYVLGRHAEPMLAAVGGGEGEAAAVGTALGDDAVVVVKGLFYGYEDASVGFGYVVFCGVVPDFGVVVAWMKRLAIADSKSSSL